MKILVNDKIVLVDGEDIPLLNYGRGWGVRSDNSVVVWFGRKKTILMHRVLMNPPDGIEVDHINGDRLDNRRCNLRLCTHAENMRNRGAEKLGNKRVETHPYKGIIRHSKKNLKKQWFAQIGCLGKTYISKRFLTEIEAAKAYDELAKKHHGKFARLNFPEK